MASTQLTKISVTFPTVTGVAFSDCVVRAMARDSNDSIRCYGADGTYLGKSLGVSSTGVFTAYVPLLQDVRLELYSNSFQSIVSVIDATGGGTSTSSGATGPTGPTGPSVTGPTGTAAPTLTSSAVPASRSFVEADRGNTLEVTAASITLTMPSTISAPGWRTRLILAYPTVISGDGTTLINNNTIPVTLPAGTYDLVGRSATASYAISSILSVVQAIGLPVNGIGRNFKPSNTRQLRAAIAGARTGTQRSRFLMTTDSYVAGYGSSGNGGINTFANSWPSMLMKEWAALGLNVNARYAAGCGWVNNTTAAGVAATDPRLSFVGGAGLYTANLEFLGGYPWSFNAAGQGVDFTPGGAAFDTIDLSYLTNVAAYNGNLTIATDGGAVQQTINTAVSSAANINVVTTSLSISGATAVNLRFGSVGAFPNMVGVRSAATPGIELINAAVSGYQLSTFALTPVAGSGTAWRPLAAMATIFTTATKNVLFLNGWFNDRSAGKSVSQCQASLDAAIKAGIAAGADVVYVGYVPLQISSISLADQTTFNEAMFATCLANDIPWIDPRGFFETQEISNAQGLYYDSLHLNRIGYAELAQAIARAIVVSG